MIIHHNEDFSTYKISIFKKIKYSESFTFVPIRLYKDNTYQRCILQTPLLFTPFGIQMTKNNKKIMDLSFQNKVNDESLVNFLGTLSSIYKIIKKKYKKKYSVNSFIKTTDFGECLRFKLSDDSLFFNENKIQIETIDKFTYGYFIIHLNGLWINDKDIWFQWNLLQAKVNIPIHLKEYSFIDVNNEQGVIKSECPPDKYDKMLKMGVPKEAVQRQKILDGNIPPPPPITCFSVNIKKSHDIPKIKASDLQSVILKKGNRAAGKSIRGKKSITKNNLFEPPTLEELQTTLSKLRPTK
jgi:hypothetical protein